MFILLEKSNEEKEVEGEVVFYSMVKEENRFCCIFYDKNDEFMYESVAPTESGALAAGRRYLENKYKEWEKAKELHARLKDRVKNLGAKYINTTVNGAGQFQSAAMTQSTSGE